MKEVSFGVNVRVVFSAGGLIKHILVGDETLKFRFDCFDKSYNIQKLEKTFQAFGEVAAIQSELDETTQLRKGIIIMKNLTNAQSIAKYYDQERVQEFQSKDNKSVHPIFMSVKPECKKLFRAIRIKFEWFEGESKGECMIDYESSQATLRAMVFINDLNNDWIFREEGGKAEMVNDRRLRVSGLKYSTDATDIRQFLVAHNLDGDLKSINVFRNATSDQSIDPVNRIRELIKGIGVEDDKILRVGSRPVQQKEGKSVKSRIDVDVYDMEVAFRIKEHLNIKLLFENSDSKLLITISFSKKWNLKREQFDLIKDDLNQEKEKIEEDHLDVKIFIYDNQNSNAIRVMVIASQVLKLDQIIAHLNPIINGESLPFTLSQHSLMVAQATKNQIISIGGEI